VAILSTGDELILPGTSMRPGLVYDSNATILADAVRELGGAPASYGIVPDDETALEAVLRQALACDAVLLSGGTSKGAGDISYRVVARLGPPGIIAHGVALKPGKPLCLAAVAVSESAERGAPSAERGSIESVSGNTHGAPLSALSHRIVPMVILPGFPTSAIFTFHEFVAPVLQRLGGRQPLPGGVVEARLPLRVNSERGRTEYLLVGLVSGSGAREQSGTHRPAPPVGWIAYPMGKGSGSVTTFSRADGFVIIPRQREYLDAGELVAVHLLG
jgi:putative molybdopterin biosynthesis protein